MSSCDILLDLTLNIHIFSVIVELLYLNYFLVASRAFKFNI